MKLKRFLSYELDAIAGIATAVVVASILHLLHTIDEHVMLPIVLALMALHFINFMRHSRNNELAAEQVDRTEHAVGKIRAGLQLAGVILLGPQHLRTANEHFAKHIRGDAIWFNVCLSMCRPPPLFDALLRPVVENPMVTSIKFALYESRKELWRQVVQPLIAGCAGHEKVTERRWRSLRKNGSFILAESRLSDGTEALLSFWGEPFMAETSGRQAPRFIFQSRSTLSIFRVLWNWSAAAYMHRPPTNKRRSYG